MQRRRFLFLQGLAGPLFTRLGDHLRALGHAVHRINFCAGDAALWVGRPASNYRGSADEWPARLALKLRELGTTDVMLFGCERPLHRAAIAVARAHGARIHARKALSGRTGSRSSASARRPGRRCRATRCGIAKSTGSCRVTMTTSRSGCRSCCGYARKSAITCAMPRTRCSTAATAPIASRPRWSRPRASCGASQPCPGTCTRLAA
jgi:hypothetical protein